MRRLLGSVDRALAQLEGRLIVLFVWAMIVFTFAQVSLRALYTHAHLQWANLWMGRLDWSEPMVRLLVLWVSFLGASLLTGENKHIKIDVFSAILPKRWLPLREVVLSVFGGIVSAVMLWVCIGYVKLEMTFAGTLFLGLPNWVGELILPIGFATILFRFMVRAFLNALQLAERGGG